MIRRRTGAKPSLTNTAFDHAEEFKDNLKAEIEALDDSIKAIDKEVEESTVTRKAVICYVGNSKQ